MDKASLSETTFYQLILWYKIINFCDARQVTDKIGLISTTPSVFGGGMRAHFPNSLQIKGNLSNEQKLYKKVKKVNGLFTVEVLLAYRAILLALRSKNY